MHKTLLLLTSLLPAMIYSQNLLTIQEDSIYLNGINIPWNNFGNDFGVNYNETYFEAVLQDCANHGVNTVRIWVHADGRGTPNFSSNGYVSGLPASFFPNLDHFLNTAESHDIMVIVCLWSFDMLKDYTSSAGPNAGMHHTLLLDSLATISYIDQVVIPMAQRYNEQCNLLAYEIINEPEWGMEENVLNFNTVDSTLPNHYMQRFVALQSKAFHEHCSQMVTLGSGSIAWNSNVSPAYGNWWSDSVLIAKTGNPLSSLDFYQIHYWDWMGFFNFDPYVSEYDTWNLDKPTIIGETPANNSTHPALSTLQEAQTANWAGTLFWSYDGLDGFGSWNDCKNALAEFDTSSALSHFMQYQAYCEPSTIIETDNLPKNPFYPNPAQNMLYLKNPTGFNKKYELYSTLGKKVGEGEIKTQINIQHLAPGTYFLCLYSNTDVQSYLFLKN